MSLCRFSDDSDVYVFYSIHGGIECCGCSLRDGRLSLPTEAEMIEHLMAHRDAGDKVPEIAIDRLREGRVT